MPDGLPEWFAGKDLNEDGQVAMHEFSTSWNDGTARQFAAHDLNNDGVITPDECITAIDSGVEVAADSTFETGFSDQEASGGGTDLKFGLKAGSIFKPKSDARIVPVAKSAVEAKTKPESSKSSGGGLWWQQ